MLYIYSKENTDPDSDNWLTDLLMIPSWPATAAAVLELGELMQSPIPKMLGYLSNEYQVGTGTGELIRNC